MNYLENRNYFEKFIQNIKGSKKKLLKYLICLIFVVLFIFLILQNIHLSKKKNKVIVYKTIEKEVIKNKLPNYLVSINYEDVRNFSKIKSKKIVAIIFAGRERFLSICLKYLEKLKKLGKLTEIHLWRFALDLNDIKYLEKTSNWHKTCKEQYGIIFRKIIPVINSNSFDLLIKGGGDAHILINNKYEIVIDDEKKHESYIVNYDNVNNHLSSKRGKFLIEEKYISFKIQIKDNELAVNSDKLSMSIELNNTENITSVEIHGGKKYDLYWDYEESENKGYKLYDTSTKQLKKWEDRNWGEAYDFYLNYDFDLLLKVDDDIIYMDLNRYDEYIYFILSNPHISFVFPNMVNHALSFYYNNKAGLLPDSLLDERYRNKSDPRNVSIYFTDANQAEKVHEHFINNTSLYINNDLAPINIDGSGLSICMFGILQENYQKFFKPVTRDSKNNLMYLNDEPYIGKQEGTYFYPRFVAFHYSFGPQLKSGLDDRYLIYFKKISDNLE